LYYETSLMRTQKYGLFHDLRTIYGAKDYMKTWRKYFLWTTCS